MQKCKGKDCSVFRFTKSLAGLLALHCFAHLYHIRAYKERSTQPARTKMNTFKQPWAPAAIPQEKQPVEAGIVRTDTQGTSQGAAPQDSSEVASAAPTAASGRSRAGCPGVPVSILPQTGCWSSSIPLRQKVQAFLVPSREATKPRWAY